METALKTKRKQIKTAIAELPENSLKKTVLESIANEVNKIREDGARYVRAVSTLQTKVWKNYCESHNLFLVAVQNKDTMGALCYYSVMQQILGKQGLLMKEPVEYLRNISN